MHKEMIKAIQEHKDAVRMFTYAVEPEDVDVAIFLMNAAAIKMKALRNIPKERFDITPIPKEEYDG